MNTHVMASVELLKVDEIVASLRALEATAAGQQALAMAQAGFTHPDDVG